jgi:isopenicillin N synthase-like dioxygenase
METPACIDLTPFLAFLRDAEVGTVPTAEIAELCRQVLESFHHTGVLVVKDPRVNDSYNSAFIDLMERYYQHAGTLLYNGQAVAEAHPELGFQIGATPEHNEKARDHCQSISQYGAEDAPLSPCPPQFDAKWRYFWRIGEMSNEPGKLERTNVIPEGFPEWETTLNRWGELMLQAIRAVVNMFEIATGLPRGRLESYMDNAPNLLAPTGSDLGRHGLGTVLAGYHYDLNFITIHGKSRFPGLSVWLRTGKKISVAVPEGHLLLQAGKMFEHVTGGFIIAGFHEVIHNEQTAAAVDKAQAEGRSLWRVSSTLFGHIRTNVELEPLRELEAFYGPDVEAVRAKYPRILTDEFVMNELREISLLGESAS